MDNLIVFTGAPFSMCCAGQADDLPDDDQAEAL
jgi:hypothetical protein